MQAQGARVVTPEAVALDVTTAGIGSRALARAIDGLIQGAALVVLLIVAGLLAVGGDGGLGTLGVVLGVVALTLVVLGYPIVWEWLWRGRTPGKAALGLRVVTTQGAPIRFRHAAVRGLLGLVEVLTLPVVGVLAMLTSRNEQRLGDLAAGTIVIKERTGVRPSQPVLFYPPPGWERLVASLDVSGMTAAEYETVRAFLLRAPAMAPVPRTDLAVRLAGPLAVRLHQGVPPGAGPELWLACAAAAYQQRHGGPFMPAPPAVSGGPPSDGGWHGARPAGPAIASADGGSGGFTAPAGPGPRRCDGDSGGFTAPA